MFVFCRFAFFEPPRPYGDGLEYNYVAESLFRHGTPEVLDADIAAAQAGLAAQSGIRDFPDPRTGLFKTGSGHRYSYHFWLYPLLATPAKAVLAALHGEEFKAFGIVNALLYIAMLWVVYLFSPKEKRLAATALSLFSPMVPYIVWPSPEAYSAALATIAIVFHLRRNPARAALFSALASCQNPPIAFFTLCVGLGALRDAAVRWRRTRRPSALLPLLRTALCSLPVLAAPLFYYRHFGTFNLIHKVGAADFSLITFHKLLSYFFDINQGAVLYSGLLLFVFLFGFARNLLRLDFRHLDLALSVFALAILSLPAPNWNCGLSVAIRYFAWCYPFLAFYVLCAVPFRRPRLGHAILAANMALLFVVNNAFAGKMNNLHHTNLAEKILTHAPWLYNPEPDIFAERIAHAEGRPSYPVAYISRNGRLTKILTTQDGWLRLAADPDFHIADPGFHARQLAKFTPKHPLRYINITRGRITWAPTLVLRDRIDFATLCKDIPGLGKTAPRGRWTTHKRVTFALRLDGTPSGSDPALRFDVTPHLSPSHPDQTVEIRANDHPLPPWTFRDGHPAPDTTLRIPRTLLADGALLILNFRIADPHSPRDLGLGSDTQKLGIAINTIELLDHTP